jgi:hypothetical protein
MAPVPISLTEPTLHNTLGAAYLGVVGAAFLFGVTTLQMYSYYHSYPKDPLFQKVAVALLWLLDALHFALTIQAVYEYCVSGFGNLDALRIIPWTIQLQVAINVFIIVLVHCLYAMRVWKLSGYHQGVLGYVSVTVVAAGFAIGVVLACKIFKAKLFTDLNNFFWVITAGLGTSTFIDFFIAGAMCWYLHKSRGTGRRLNSRIAVVMQYTLCSGLLTSACSLSTMFTYILLPNTFVFLGLQFMLTKFYVVSFIAMLNARERPVKQTASAEPATQHTTPSGKKTPITSLWGSEQEVVIPKYIEWTTYPVSHARTGSEETGRHSETTTKVEASSAYAI